jgi:hypothetical protein
LADRGLARFGVLSYAPNAPASRGVRRFITRHQRDSHGNIVTTRIGSIATS